MLSAPTPDAECVFAFHLQIRIDEFPMKMDEVRSNQLPMVISVHLSEESDD